MSVWVVGQCACHVCLGVFFLLYSQVKGLYCGVIDTFMCLAFLIWSDMFAGVIAYWHE
jgi:hypothetical protein